MDMIFEEDFIISKYDRNRLQKHNSFFILFTGYSGSGKSTLAKQLELVLHKNQISTYCLDGDNVRGGINKNLDFSPEDRAENLRRIAEISSLFVDAGIVILASFVAPYEKDRQRMKEIIGAENFYEIHVATSIEECERRDVKGLYAKVRNGEIKNFTGINAPYETPSQPNLTIDTENKDINTLVTSIFKSIKNHLVLQ